MGAAYHDASRRRRRWQQVEVDRVVARPGVDLTHVSFLPMTEAEIAEYVASGEPMDKAGAYGIQGLASKFIYRVKGCYFNVVGLPVSRVYGFLRSASEHGFH